MLHLDRQMHQMQNALFFPSGFVQALQCLYPGCSTDVSVPWCLTIFFREIDIFIHCSPSLSRIAKQQNLRQAAQWRICARSAAKRGQGALQSAKNCRECRRPKTAPDDWKCYFSNKKIPHECYDPESFLCQCYPPSSQNILRLMEQISHWSSFRFYKPMGYSKCYVSVVPFQEWEEVSHLIVLILWGKQVNIIINCWQVICVSL